MCRDSLILLVLKEIFKDPYLVNYIYNIYEKDEIHFMSILHKIKTYDLRNDVQLLYPGFMKTALFENIHFDNNDNIDPGFCVYIVRPLTDCGYLLNYDDIIPYKYSISHDSSYRKGYNGVKLINDSRRKYSKNIDNKFNILINRRDKYVYNELCNKSKKSIWYDFENEMFSSF